MTPRLVGSEMCIRDRQGGAASKLLWSEFKKIMGLSFIYKGLSSFYILRVLANILSKMLPFAHRMTCDFSLNLHAFQHIPMWSSSQNGCLDQFDLSSRQCLKDQCTSSKLISQTTHNRKYTPKYRFQLAYYEQFQKKCEQKINHFD